MGLLNDKIKRALRYELFLKAREFFLQPGYFMEHVKLRGIFL